MKLQSVLVYLAALSMFIGLMAGCSKKKETAPAPDEPGTPVNNTANADTRKEANSLAGIGTAADFNYILSAWDSGNKEESTKQFIQTDWDKPGVFANISDINISMQDFKMYSEEQQIQIGRKLQTLGLHVLSAGDALLASGDKAGSQTYYDAVLKCARSTASRDHLEMLDITTRGLIKAVEDRVSSVQSGQDYQKRLQRQAEEVRTTFLSLQQACKANDIDGYLDFWDDESKKAIDPRSRNLDQIRQRRRESLKKRPGTLEQIASAKVKSITPDYWEAELIKKLFGVEIKGSMMLVRTTSEDLLFHETTNGWKLLKKGSSL